CLERNRASRIGDLSTALFILSDPSSEPDRPLRSHAPIVVGAVAMLGLAALSGLAIRSLYLSRAPMPSVTRFVVPLGSQIQFTATGRHLLALSPDGRRLVYGANGQLHLRYLDRLEATAMRATGGEAGNFGRNPFFSPDGEWVGFWQDHKLRKVR